MRKLHSVTLAVTTISLLAWSTAGRAGIAGNYTGKAADGSSVYFTVATDGNGKLAVTSFSINFSATCKGTTPSSYASGWGIGMDAVIKSGKASYVDGKGGGNVLFIPLTFDFNTSPVSGTEAVRVAILATSTTPPSTAEMCYTTKQTFTAIKSAAPPPAELPPGAVIHLP
jgi:hypothetical protein